MRAAHAPLAVCLAVAAAGAALSGCDQPFLSARVEVPEVRIVTAPKDFQAPGGGNVDPSLACSLLVAATGRTCAGVTNSYDLGGDVPGLNEKGVAVDLRLTDVALHLTAGGVSDLRGVTRAEVDVKDPSSGAVTRVASYVRPPGATPTSIVVSGASDLDLSPYLREGKIDARVEVEMDPAALPTGFSAAIEAGFSVMITVNYRELL